MLDEHHKPAAQDESDIVFQSTEENIFNRNDVNWRVFVIVRIKERVIEFNEFRFVMKNRDKNRILVGSFHFLRCFRFVIHSKILLF